MGNLRKLPSIDLDTGSGLFTRFCQTVETSPLWNKSNQRICVGYSGGLDSTVLLHLWMRYCHLQHLQATKRQLTGASFSLSAFHLHHGISPYADAWLAHCTQQCTDWAIPFSYFRAGLGAGCAEQAARQARYVAYAQLDADVVALAHHQNDQAETLLYRLLRGSGVHGAGAMPAIRSISNGVSIWRPLLNESRATLETYAAQQKLMWINDESNDADVYARNFLRHRIFPLLHRRFPAASRTLARAAAHFAETAQLADTLAELDAGQSTANSHTGRLSVGQLNGLSPPRQRNLLRWFLAQHDVHLESKQLAPFLAQLLTARSDSNPVLRINQWVIRRYRDEVWITPFHPPMQLLAPFLLSDSSPCQPAGWHGRLSWIAPQEPRLGIASTAIAGLCVRPRQGGERMRTQPNGANRLVKQLLQEAHIPPWLRDQWPLLWHGDELVAIAGVAVSASAQVADGLWPVWELVSK